jgi:polar amino acid transport system permease protein
MQPHAMSKEARLEAARSVLPRSWSRERRSAVAILLALTGLIAFLWLLAIPLSWLPDPISPAAAQFADGAQVTVELTVLSGLIGIAIGILAALGKLSSVPPVRWFAGFYVWAIRGTPLLVQILFVFYALPELMPVKLSDFYSAVVALALNAGAYNAEAIRAGILAVHKGQAEAARSLGLTPFQTFRHIVFPQSFRIALPSLVNNIVSLLKDSSLAYAIGVVELLNIGNRIQAASFEPIPVLLTTASIYLILTSILTQVSGTIERQLDVEQHH